MSTDDPGGRPGGRRTGLGTISTMVALGSAQAATAVAMLLLARRTDTQTFGAFVSLYAITTALGALIDFGSSQHHTRELAQGVGRQIHRAWLDRRTLFQAPVGVVTALLAWVAYRDHLPVVAIVGISMQSVAFSRSLGESAAVRALRSSATAEWLVALGNTSMLVAVIAAPAELVVEAAGVFASLSWLVTASVGAWLVRDQVRTRRVARRVRNRRLVNPWQGSSGFGIAAASIAGQGLMVPLLGWRAGVASAAEVGAVGKWAQPIMLFAAAYATYTFPHLAAAPDDRTALKQMKPLVGVVAVGSTLALGLFVAAGPLVDLLLPDDYADSADVLRWYALAAIPVLVGQPMMALLQARQVDEFVATVTATVNVIGLLAVGALATTLGAPTVPIVTFAVSSFIAGVYVVRASTFRQHRVDDSEYAGHPALARLGNLGGAIDRTSPTRRPAMASAGRLAVRTGRSPEQAPDTERRSGRRDRGNRPNKVRQPQLLGEFDASASAAFELVVGPIAQRRDRPGERLDRIDVDPEPVGAVVKKSRRRAHPFAEDER